MALNYMVARTLLKQFVAQETSNCPSYFCPNIATIGLCYNRPVVVSTAEEEKNPKYYTYELRSSAYVKKDVEIPPPSGISFAFGYQRDILGEIQNGKIVDHLKKMCTPTTEGTGEKTDNESIIILGENTSDTAYWPAVTYFALFNTDGTMDQSEEGVDPTGEYVGVRYSKHLVLFGAITSTDSQGQPTSQITVGPGTVPLFRKGNFKLTFASN